MLIYLHIWQQCKSKFWQIPFSLTKENKKILSAKCPALLVHRHCFKGLWFAYSWYWGFHGLLRFMVSFYFLQNVQKHLLRFFYFTEMEWDSLFRHMPTRWLSLWLAIENTLKYWPAVKSLFSKCGVKRMSLSNLEILWGWEWRKVLW